MPTLSYKPTPLKQTDLRLESSGAKSDESTEVVKKSSSVEKRPSDLPNTDEFRQLKKHLKFSDEKSMKFPFRVRFSLYVCCILVPQYEIVNSPCLSLQTKLMGILYFQRFSDCVEWDKNGESIVIKDQKEFLKKAYPAYIAGDVQPAR